VTNAFNIIQHFVDNISVNLTRVTWVDDKFQRDEGEKKKKNGTLKVVVAVCGRFVTEHFVVRVNPLLHGGVHCVCI